jgi:hypothetical protein
VLAGQHHAAHLTTVRLDVEMGPVLVVLEVLLLSEALTTAVAHVRTVTHVDCSEVLLLVLVEEKGRFAAGGRTLEVANTCMHT